MNAIARYLLVFLLGWSGAVFSYSDLIYPKNKATLNKTLNAEHGEPSSQANKVPSLKDQEPLSKVNGKSVDNSKSPAQPES